MCQRGNDRLIYVIRRNNDHAPDGWHAMYVDACIADYVQTMNNRGILTLGCCCGHGKQPASVLVMRESASLMELYRYSFSDYENGLLIHTIE